MPEAIAIAAMQGFALALAFFALREIYRRLRHRQGIGLGTSSSPPLLAPGSTGRSFRPPSKSPRSRRCSHISRASSSFGVACRRPRNCHSGYFSRRRFGFVGCSARWCCKVKEHDNGILTFARRHGEQPGHLPGRPRARAKAPMVAFDGRVRRADVRGTCRKSRQRGPLREGIRAYLAHDYVTAAGSSRTSPRTATQWRKPISATCTPMEKAYRKILSCRRDVQLRQRTGRCGAQYALGLMYTSPSVPQDYVAAYALLNLAVGRLAAARAMVKGTRCHCF